ncbi:hypothetical protein TREMEDRAFT_74116 [Tremella mesenterica DSM 1558]|uniref:uncharacterized protein n=1 Tax=Tremella mesenterica (strain ATCC 24925 / CBS 8224 / DSM 1558 / NBRC 9311 / NRRL Y-6157 / RJB 2259-6 / UBC 559-6) TaxID=578456 RepID=UPI0003F4A448|nr:uncharacterized protein TREMEDRAFT_74116 [Tremella mesenterica DSM 1558]EIW68634.1 hypothetical protein TREMEDRAFT_74116 [Tremella mesenterica DSM 1558]
MFGTLNAYLKTQSSPLYTQTGINGQLAAQIDTSFPLAASASSAIAPSTTSDGSGSHKRTIIIAVSVTVGVLVWFALIYWVYRRVKKHNDHVVHKRLSEHMSMFEPPRDQMSQIRSQRPISIAASEVDDRPSSFYASPIENERASRRNESTYSSSYGAVDGHTQQGRGSPTSPGADYGPSVFGTSWFNTGAHQLPPPIPTSQSGRGSNPFEDIVTRSYLSTAGGQGQRRSQMPKVQKGMIGNPTLQGNSLEFHDPFADGHS